MTMPNKTPERENQNKDQHGKTHSTEQGKKPDREQQQQQGKKPIAGQK